MELNLWEFLVGIITLLVSGALSGYKIGLERGLKQETISTEDWCPVKLSDGSLTRITKVQKHNTAIAVKCQNHLATKKCAVTNKKCLLKV